MGEAISDTQFYRLCNAREDDWYFGRGLAACLCCWSPNEQLQMAEATLALAETQYTAKLFQQLVAAESNLNQFAVGDKDEASEAWWPQAGSTSMKRTSLN
jgi:hypothetical protein